MRIALQSRPLPSPAEGEYRSEALPVLALPHEGPGGGWRGAVDEGAVDDGTILMRQNLHVYNARSALTLETRCEALGGKRVACTVNLEIANVRSGAPTGEPGTRFDWSDKERIKVGLEDELPDLFAVIAGWLPEAEFLYHGPRRTKGYRAFALDHRVLIETFSDERGRRSVALQPAARARAAAALFRVLQREYGGLANEALMTLLQSIYTSGGSVTNATHGLERRRTAPGTTVTADDEKDPYDW